VVVSADWTVVIGISVLAMAAVQVALFIGLIVAWRQTTTRVREIEGRVQMVLDEVRPQLVTFSADVTTVLEDVRTASKNMQALASDVQDRLIALDDTARSVRARVNRVADTLQWAAASLPVPVRLSGPAAVAAWAGVRAAKSFIGRARPRV
jgi:uncharacterized protein YoxC